MSWITYINWVEQFNSEVIQKKWVVLVDFYADWCMPCKILGPIFEELQKENEGKEIAFTKVNTETNQELAMQFRITSIPVIYIFKDWQFVDALVGLREKAFYQNVIDWLLTS